MVDLKEILELAIALTDSWKWQTAALLFGCLLLFRLKHVLRAISATIKVVSQCLERRKQRKCDHFFLFPGGYIGLDNKFYIPNPPSLAICAKCAKEVPTIYACQWEVLKGRDPSDPLRSPIKPNIKIQQEESTNDEP